ncbi:MAG: hypothetical protein ACI9FR_003225 [Cryomorphaceae bacterium]|jgi:hypothetical protein
MNTESTVLDTPIVGPFSEMAAQIRDALINAIAPRPPSSFWWPLLVLTITISIVFWFFRKGRGAKGASGHEWNFGSI